MTVRREACIKLLAATGHCKGDLRPSSAQVMTESWFKLGHLLQVTAEGQAGSVEGGLAFRGAALTGGRARDTQGLRPSLFSLPALTGPGEKTERPGSIHAQKSRLGGLLATREDAGKPSEQNRTIHQKQALLGSGSQPKTDSKLGNAGSEKTVTTE